MDIIKHEVTNASTGETFLCAEDDFIFNAVIRNRSGDVIHGCCGGGCGICKMSVKGQVYVAKRMSRAHISPEEEANGVMLLCCVKPRGNVTISRV